MTTTEELLRAALTAPAERRQAALRVLNGEGERKEERAGPEAYGSLRAAGRHVGVSPCTLWRWGIPGHDLGGRRRFRVSEILAYLETDAFKQRAAELKADRKRLRDTRRAA